MKSGPDRKGFAVARHTRRFIALAALLTAPNALAQSTASDECFPACRRGYECSKGQCVQGCNPPCGPNEQCSAGECVTKPSQAPRQDAPLPPPAAPPPRPPPPASDPSGHDGWATAAAWIGFGSAAAVLTFGLASEATKSQQDPSIPLGATATLIVAGVAPVVFVGGASARSGTGNDGIPGLRIAGWIAYGVTLTSAVVLIAEGLAQVEPPTGEIAATAALGAFSLVAFSVDALASRGSALASLPSDRTTAARWTLGLAPVAGARGRTGGMVGLVGGF